jgi:site-specific recombinase XerC
MASYRKIGRNWFYRFVDGVQRERKGCPDRRETEAMAAAAELQISKIKGGLIDPRALRYRDYERTPVADHLDAFRASIVAKGSGVKHADKTRTRAERIIALGGVGKLSDLSLSRVDKALSALRSEGLSTETLNHYIRAIKGFARWCWKDGRTRDHQLVAKSTTSPESSRTFTRRALSHEESPRLVVAAEHGPVVMGMTGPDRAMAYRVALGTGFRVEEMASLTPGSFALDGKPPTIVCEAGYTKFKFRRF